MWQKKNEHPRGAKNGNDRLMLTDMRKKKIGALTPQK